MFTFLKEKTMKKLLVTFVLALGFSSISLGQKKGDVEFGVNIGVNYSTVTESSSFLQADSGFGINAGFSADYYFSKQWSIKGKLIYDQKGWDNGTFEDEFGVYSTNYNLNYLTVPVMANWHFGRTNNWYLNFGPYAGFLLSAEETTGGIDVKEAFNTTDFGIAFGIGVKIPVSDKLKLNLEYEGQGGFSDIFKVSNTGRVTNSRGAFNVGLNFLMK